MFLGNLDKMDTKKHFQTSDIFVNEILLIWAELNFNKNISSLQHYKHSASVWDNSLIRIDRKPVYFREWLAKGISTVESLIKDDTRFLSYTEFLNKYHCQSCPLAFNGIISTLKTLRKSFKENIDSLETVETESFTKAFQKTKTPANERIGISLPTNSFLHKIAVKESDLCTFCKEETDTLLHLFWQCKVTSVFWGSFLSFNGYNLAL